jgi:PhoH-like ATPase
MASHTNGHRNLSPKATVITNKGNVLKNKFTVRGTNTEFIKKLCIPKNLRRIQPSNLKIITYVLDTNVLLNAWDSIFKFEEHNVYIVSQVWKELDKSKKGPGDTAYNARHAISHIDKLIAGKSSAELKEGTLLVPPSSMSNGKPHTGKLFLDFSKPVLPTSVDIELSLDEPDDRIIMVCLALKEKGHRVVLVSNDGNCRVKANYAEIEAEEYLGDTSVNLMGEEDLRTGFHYMPADFWNKERGHQEPITDGEITRYNLSHPKLRKINSQEFIVLPDGLKLQVTKKLGTDDVIAETFPNFYRQKISGIKPRNIEQEFALQLLIDERVRAVCVAGLAGSGKNYIALAAAFHLINNLKLYDRIIITRSTIGSDEDIGFLPGDETEKMAPWMGSLHDNLEILANKMNKPGRGSKENLFASLLSKIQMRSLNFMKGRTLNRTLLIVDEAQDLTTKKLKMIATRVGNDSKIVFLGNVAQIDDSYLTEHTCGVSVFIRVFADSTIVGHVTLQRGERSAFATEAEERL